jgi:hypothetical protein
VLSAVSKVVASDLTRASSLGRIALDSYFAHFALKDKNSKEIARKETDWPLVSFLENQSISDFISAMIQGSSEQSEESQRIAPYQHTWDNPRLQSRTQWVVVLIDEISKRNHLVELSTWIATCIKRLNPLGDKDWQVAQRIVKLVHDLPGESRTERENLLDFAISSAAIENGTTDKLDDLILDLIGTRYRVADTLKILESSLEERSKTSYVDGMLAKVATASAELFPEESIADNYLAKMRLPADRAVAIDQVAQRRNRPSLERLRNLQRAPQGREVLERTVSLCENLTDKLTELSTEELSAFGGALIRLVPTHPNLYRHLGIRMSYLIGEDELTRARADEERLPTLLSGQRLS